MKFDGVTEKKKVFGIALFMEERSKKVKERPV